MRIHRFERGHPHLHNNISGRAMKTSNRWEYQQLATEDEGDPSREDVVSIARQSKHARTKHPTDFIRTNKVDHLPIILESKKRCKLTGCKSNKARHQCPTCKVTLCLMTGRNCYKEYHEK